MPKLWVKVLSYLVAIAGKARVRAKVMGAVFTVVRLSIVIVSECRLSKNGL